MPALKRRHGGLWTGLLSAILLFCTFTFLPVKAASSMNVGWVYLEGVINPGTAIFVERALEEARDSGVSILVLELDTPGGYLDSTEVIQRKITEAKVPVYAFVNNRALSAGAFLALSCDGLYMVPGSTIGAAEPRLLGGEVITDPKVLSAWEANMRAAAEQQGKDPGLAAAMVNRELEIAGVVEAGELLTLTAGEAQSLNFLDAIVKNEVELLEILEVTKPHVIPFRVSFSERLTGWVTQPTAATLLLTLGIVFLISEIFTAGFGIAGLLSILCFSFFFGSHLMAGVAGWEAVVLFIFGLALLVAEAFVPGFGLLGIAGLISVAVSVALTAASAVEGLKMLLIALLVSAVLAIFAFRFFQKKGLLRKVVLFNEERKDLGYVAPSDKVALLGLTGRALTPLRPSGRVLLQGEQVDVLSEGGFIPTGTKVKVIRVEGYRIVVRPWEKEEFPEKEGEK